MAIATFKTLLYSQQLAAGEKINYSALYRRSWRNVLTLGLALAFAGVFWLILMLCGALFKAIKIEFFQALFEEPWFYYPAIALAVGFGIIIFRRLSHVIDTITRLKQALAKFLLVLLVLVSLLFLGALPFTGLEPLWNSGGSALILWLQALMLLFVNVVYQDEPRHPPYSRWTHRFITLGVALLPVYSAIACYGLSLRVSQYGWTVDRAWAYLIWLLLALFPLGYLWGILQRRDNWLYQLSRVNIAAGLVVLAAMLLVNSPLLDFRKIVARDQLQRLADGEVAPDEFDISYFRYSLARPGYEGLQQIREQYGETHPALLVRIDQLYHNPAEEGLASSPEEFNAAIEVLAGNPPAELLAAIYRREAQNPWLVQHTQHYYLAPLDLNEDSQTDYLLVAKTRGGISLTLFYREERQWHAAAMATTSQRNREDFEAFFTALKAGKFTLSPPRWNKLEIGDRQFEVRAEEGRALQSDPEVAPTDTPE